MIRLVVAVLATLLAIPPGAQGQSPFAPVLTVNGNAITGYEIDQRARMMQAIGVSGDLLQLARDALIDDRLRMAAARAAGIRVPDEDVQTEMENFVQRGNVSLDQFREVLAANGVDFETFENYSRMSVTWREFVRARFASRVQISEDEVDRALSLTAEGGLRVLLSEIVIPVPEGADPAETVAFAEDLSESISSQREFERAARRYSAAATRNDGGRIDWIDLNRLPQNVQTVLLGMSPGEVSPPIQLSRAVVLFQLRGLAEAPASQPQLAAVEYMLVRFPAEQGEGPARAIAAASDVCTDVYAATTDLPEDAIQRESRVPADIPPRLRAELETLDPGEASTRLRSEDGSEIWLVMLCGRSPAIPEGETREQIVQRFRGQRLETLANGFLAELKAAAQIERK